MFTSRRFALAGTLVAIGYHSLVFAESPNVLFTSSNAAVERLPTLGVRKEYDDGHDRHDWFISADFPNAPGCICDLWCYESADIVYTSAEPLTGGGVEMRHTWQGRPWEVVTTATPREGAVEVVARLEATGDKPATEPKEYPALNICWQLRRAERFRSQPDPYPEFVKRCFIFTQRGRAFLDHTRRLPIPVRPLTDKENNPPWVQMYLPESAPSDIKADAGSWASYSPDRFTLPMIGAISRDGKFLAAIATGAQVLTCQAWHDCMHCNARWLPEKGDERREWRVHIYALENDPAALTARFEKDFPNVQPWEN